MKNLKKFLSFSFLLLPIIFGLNIYYSIPSKLILTQNSKYSLSLNYPCSINTDESIKSVSSKDRPLSEKSDGKIFLNTNSCGNYDLSVKLFDKIPIKTISVTVAPAKYVVPSGDTIGVKLYTDGLLIVALSDFLSEDGITVSPAKSAGLQEGDRIIAVNDVPVKTSEELSEQIVNSDGAVTLTIIRNETKENFSIFPIVSAENKTKKLGAWVRDSTAGIGTLTYYDPTNSSFAALGHAICDTDTGDIMTVRQGNIMSCNIMSVAKGSPGNPGELIGSFSNHTIGDITQNTELGIYGKLNDFTQTDFSNAVGVATRYQIKEGDAQILADIDGSGVKSYSAEILKVSDSAKIDNKGLIIKINDQTLIEKTGGIVQGMSGAPIIQNNLLVGAVTHVFVNDPTRGYGIFAENLLNITNMLE